MIFPHLLQTEWIVPEWLKGCWREPDSVAPPSSRQARWSPEAGGNPLTGVSSKPNGFRLSFTPQSSCRNVSELQLRTSRGLWRGSKTSPKLCAVRMNVQFISSALFFENGAPQTSQVETWKRLLVSPGLHTPQSTTVLPNQRALPAI